MLSQVEASSGELIPGPPCGCRDTGNWSESATQVINRKQDPKSGSQDCRRQQMIYPAHVSTLPQCWLRFLDLMFISFFRICRAMMNMYCQNRAFQNFQPLIDNFQSLRFSMMTTVGNSWMEFLCSSASFYY